MSRAATKRRRDEATKGIEPPRTCATARLLRRGFTLVELVMVLAIVAIVAAIGMPRYATALGRYRAHLGAQRVAADLELARQTARNRSTSIEVQFRTADHMYVLVGIDDPDTKTPDMVVSLAAEPYRAKLALVDLNALDSVKFDGYGNPNRTGTIIVESNGNQQQVTLDESGGVDLP